MFKILTYKQLFEKEDNFYWVKIDMPENYPNKKSAEVWITAYFDDLLNKKIRFLYEDWDFSTHNYEIDQKESTIIDMFESEGYVVFVTDEMIDYKVLPKEIEVKKPGKRVFNEQDPYGEEE